MDQIKSHNEYLLLKKSFFSSFHIIIIRLTNFTQKSNSSFLSSSSTFTFATKPDHYNQPSSLLCLPSLSKISTIYFCHFIDI
uniref:Uncharacterized protein n=1 Tax=Tetranychus urticae TaxID=32264 RepID=T1KUP1_TETUR